MLLIQPKKKGKREGGKKRREGRRVGRKAGIAHLRGTGSHHSLRIRRTSPASIKRSGQAGGRGERGKNAIVEKVLRLFTRVAIGKPPIARPGEGWIGRPGDSCKMEGRVYEEGYRGRVLRELRRFQNAKVSASVGAGKWGREERGRKKDLTDEREFNKERKRKKAQHS